MTRVEPSFSDGWVFSFRGSAIAAGGAWDHGRKSELLFAGAFVLGNDDLLRPTASGPLV
jgi:hypothetical protein